MLIVLVGIKIWGKNKSILKAIHNESETEGIGRNYKSVWIAVSIFIVVGGIASFIMIGWQSKILANQAEKQNKRILELTEITESIRKNNQVNLMSNVLNQVEAELKLKPEGPLSDAVIARISALSFSLKPYRFMIGDSLSDYELSPERGQLLVALSHMGIDSISFYKIKNRTTFEKADLRGIKLKSIDLSYINLEEADLSNSEISKVNLSYSNLKKVRLMYAVIDSSSFILSSMVKSWFIKSSSKSCNYSLINASESDLSYSSFYNSSFISSNLKFSDLTFCFLDKVNMCLSNLERANFSFCNLQNSNLKKSRLKFVNLDDIKFVQTNFDSSEVQQNWFSDIQNYNNIANDYFNKNFKIRPDTNFINGIIKYRLLPKA